MKKRQNAEILPELIELKDQKVADIGSGDGAIARLMTRHGAKVFGIECNPEQLRKAREATPAGTEEYFEGVAEKLPFSDASLDIVVLFNSLHHVDIDQQDKALGEAARVLKAGGIAYICEPVAEGTHFEMMQPVHDETVVRAHALEAIKAAPRQGFSEQQEITYVNIVTYADFEQFRERILRINPHKADDFTNMAADLKKSFERLGVKTDAGWTFDQPMRVNLLKKD
ncbi:class I SAM-dependent methyltransferase [Varunaivibrio sulfuroxidans]|uniref:Pimeloyl-CoA biosynthesis protein BioC n=1 Tax=Varunaivibrio sulfuroxidans TaxID=1773489 RepID=A0A4R3J8S0_9PROT|nr:class I SAM-dependent methyltransferase [Varunaivibrio sulfuroxidans]TCS60930.1 pimeloyl-CoA biosynthesis protein BioC [Varunaivibrio sulfuroxidans]WES31662.1 class I SAM-dependent methyltransferase [Varunaivibrio sulfuroxidans]